MDFLSNNQERTITEHNKFRNHIMSKFGLSESHYCGIEQNKEQSQLKSMLLQHGIEFDDLAKTKKLVIGLARAGRRELAAKAEIMRLRPDYAYTCNKINQTIYIDYKSPNKDSCVAVPYEENLINCTYNKIGIQVIYAFWYAGEIKMVRPKWDIQINLPIEIDTPTAKINNEETDMLKNTVIDAATMLLESKGFEFNREIFDKTIFKKYNIKYNQTYTRGFQKIGEWHSIKSIIKEDILNFDKDKYILDFAIRR